MRCQRTLYVIHALSLLYCSTVYDIYTYSVICTVVLCRGALQVDPSSKTKLHHLSSQVASLGWRPTFIIIIIIICVPTSRKPKQMRILRILCPGQPWPWWIVRRVNFAGVNFDCDF